MKGYGRNGQERSRREAPSPEIELKSLQYNAFSKEADVADR
jgi:hypothetical protein